MNIRLWEFPAPHAIGSGVVDEPWISAYFPEPRRCGTAVIICPGGGYAELASHEGEEYAKWLNQLGITAFVLRYRLSVDGYDYRAMVQDVLRAIRLVRQRSDEWLIDRSKIGIMGSSAGGHLASVAMVHSAIFEDEVSDKISRISSRPDFGILCYPVISMTAFAHEGSRENFFGAEISRAVWNKFSTQDHVTSETPPCFLWSSQDDEAVMVENSLLFAAALQRNKVAMSFHIYPTAPHGIGLGQSSRDPISPQYHPWTEELKRWLADFI